MLEKIFWVVTANKIRIFIQNNVKKYSIIAKIILFGTKYKKVFKSSSNEWKYFLIIWPFLNVFLFSSFFAFIIIIISNFILYNKIENEEINSTR